MDLAKHLLVDENGEEWLIYNGGKRRIWRDMFTVQMPVYAAIAAAGGTQTQQVQIPGDADFLWQEACWAFDVALAAYTLSTAPVPNMSILLSDTASARQLSNASVPIINLFGTLGEKHVLPFPKLFAANTTIQGVVTNFDAAVATGNLRLSLIGQKIFYLS